MISLRPIQSSPFASAAPIAPAAEPLTLKKSLMLVFTSFLSEFHMLYPHMIICLMLHRPYRILHPCIYLSAINSYATPKGGVFWMPVWPGVQMKPRSRLPVRVKSYSRKAYHASRICRTQGVFV